MKTIIPQIPIKKDGLKMFDKDLLMQLPMSEIYGRLNLKFMDYHERHVYINKLLQNIYTLHSLEKSFISGSEAYSLKMNYNQILFSTETVIYWIRKNIDELIGLHYYINYLLTEKKEPEDLKISSIGVLFHKKNIEHPLYKLFESHSIALKRINNISNTFKHSFINSEAHHLIGTKEPTVNCIEMKWNIASKAKFHSYYLRDILEDYIKFFVDARLKLQSFNWEKVFP